MDLIYLIFIWVLISIPFIQVVFSYLICVLYPHIILCIPLRIALIFYPNILRIPLPIAYASLMHSFDFIPKQTSYAFPYAWLMHPLCIALILYPNIILRIPLHIVYASLTHSFDFITKHHLMHSLTHNLHIPYA